MNEDEHITMEVISSPPAHDALVADLPRSDPRDAQLAALQAENLVLSDRIAGLEREADALRQQVADLDVRSPGGPARAARPARSQGPRLHRLGQRHSSTRSSMP